MPFPIILREDIESLNLAHQLGIYFHTHRFCIGNLTLYQSRGGFSIFMATYIPTIVDLSQPAKRRTALIAAERSYTRRKYHHT